MHPEPLISVVIPCLNQGHYLRAALQSVADQAFPGIETVVVDDGSTDDTVQVASAAGAVVLQQSHAGVSAARNRGLERARGRFVIFLDADDELERDAVRSGVVALEQHPDAWMLARCCTLIDAAGERLTTDIQPPASADLYGEWLFRNLVWTPGAAVFRRHPLLMLGGFPHDVGPAADYAVYLELARANRVVFDARRVVRYRQHDTNMSRDASRMLRATLRVLRRERSKLLPGYLHQYRRGLDAWRTFYGEQIIQQLRWDVRHGRIGREQFGAVWLLVSECGRLVLTHLTRKLGRVLGGHPPSQVEPGRFARPDDGGSLQPEHSPVEARR